MGLTDTRTFYLFGLLALAAPVASLLLWNRVRGPRAARTALRIALVVSCQLTAVLSVGVAANDWGAFYPSWSSLLGAAGKGDRRTFHFGAAVAPAVPVALAAPRASADPTPDATPDATPDPTPDATPHPTPDPTPDAATPDPTPEPVSPDSWHTASWSTPAEWPTRGAIVDTRLGGATGLSERAYVYLPPAYFGAEPARRLPVVEVFTGYPGHPAHLFSQLHYPDELLAAVRAGEARQMVLVMTMPSATFPWDTECTDVPGGPQSLTYLIHDIPAALHAMFGLDPSAYAAAGTSTGGYCAAKLPMFAPEEFGAAVAMSPYPHPATDRSTRGIFAHRRALRNENDLEWRLTHLPIPATSLLIATSRDERGVDGYETARHWLRLVRAPMSADELVLEHGGHNIPTWRSEVPYVLRWLSAHLPPDAGVQRAGGVQPAGGVKRAGGVQPAGRLQGDGAV